MDKQTDKFYDRFSMFYPLVDVFLRAQKLKMFEEINKLMPGKLLEIGVGDGKHLALYKHHQVTGIDNSRGMLEIAVRHHGKEVELLHMDGENLLFENESFDYVVLSHVIAVVDRPDQLLTEVRRVLKHGGTVFILNHFTPANCLKYIDHFFQAISRVAHFKSVFYKRSLSSLNMFKPVREIDFRYSYFKLLILEKV